MIEKDLREVVIIGCTGKMKEPFLFRLLHAASFCLLFLSISTPSLASPTVEGKTKSCETEACQASARIMKKSMDINVDPCDDFYLHACGNWMKTKEGGSGTIIARDKKNNKDIIEFLKKNNTDSEPKAVHKIRALYSQCLNQESNNTNDVMKKILRDIGIPSDGLISNETTTQNFDYTTALAKLARKTNTWIYFEVEVVENPFDRTINSIQVTPTPLWKYKYYEDDDSESETATEKEELLRSEEESQLCANVSSLFCSHSTRDYNLIARFSDSKDLQIAVENSTSSNDSLSSDFTFYTLFELQNITNNIAKQVNSNISIFNWTRYIEEIFAEVPNVTLDFNDLSKVKIITEHSNVIQNPLKDMHKRSMEDIKKIITTKVRSSFKTHVKESLGDLEKKEKACSMVFVISFGVALSYLYSSKEKYVRGKTEIEDMYEHIRASLKEIIQQASWMDEKTKEKALKKLSLMKSRILFPNWIKSATDFDNYYSYLNLGDNFLDSMLYKIEGEIKKQFSVLHQTNNYTKSTIPNWMIPPTLVNAVYIPTENAIVIPAAIAGIPLFDADRLKALNYAGIGSVLGHEITHGFDNEGRKYNEIGSIEDWWHKETLKEYKKRVKCFVKAYDTYNVTFNNITLKGDSASTLGEDISDNGGFKESLFAYRKYVSENGEEPVLPQFENYTHEQLFTLAFANLWCETPSEDSEMEVVFSDHSPNGVRTNGVLKNSKEFSEIWKCPKGSNMNPNVEKCSLW